MTTPRYAGFWLRFIAEMVDSTILSVLSIIGELIIFGIIYWIMVLRTPAGASAPSFTDTLNPIWVQAINMVLYAGFAVPYYVYWHYKHGTTIGKRMLSVYVVDEKTHGRISLRQSYIRCFGYAVSYLPMCAGYLMAALHPEKRALHDLMAGTVSIIRKAPKSGSKTA